MKKQTIIRGKTNNPLVFCIVHWNAPDYLLLNIHQIRSLYPQSKIYVLDNGSQKVNFEAAKKGLEKFNNVTLFAIKLQNENLVTRLINEVLLNSYYHAKALQLLLNYSAEQSDEIAVFLDQDCVLSNNIDSLLRKLGEEVVLIGARDYVVIPKNYGPLKKGILRDHSMYVHASFMILQPKRIKRLLGNFFFFNTQNFSKAKGFSEAYHELSFRLQGKIFFLETQMHKTIPFLTKYTDQNVTYAWHAWYSSRSLGLTLQSQLDNFPVSWLQEVRKLAIDFLS